MYTYHLYISVWYTSQWASSNLQNQSAIRERPLESQGGLSLFLKKKIPALGLANKNILASTTCEQNILVPSIEKQCLLSILEKKMSALYIVIHANEMSALYT